MNLSEELRRHAAECGQMAHLPYGKDSRGDSKESRAAWNSIAERYRRCAQWYDARHMEADRLKQDRLHKKPSRPPSSLDS